MHHSKRKFCNTITTAFTTNEKQIANIMNEHFVSITKKLSLKSTISSKISDSDFFHDHIIIKKIK